MDDDVVPYIGERTRIVRGIACTEAMGIEVFDDIPVTKTEGRRDEHVGRFVFAKYPLTTAQVLAIAVLKGEPCGEHLVDELIGSGVIDPDAEALRLARHYERERLAATFDTLAAEHDGDNAGYYWRDAAHVIRNYSSD